jgi:hypothetical protein
MNENPPDVASAVNALRRACGEDIIAIIFFGSRLVGTSPGAHSAADLFIVVEEYLPFYRRLRGVYPMRHGARVLATANRVLPPNVISLIPQGSEGPGCKAVVISGRDLARALSPNAADHFCMGRLSQMTRTVHVRDDRAAAWIEEVLGRARRTAIEWVPLYRTGSFTTGEFARTMIDISYRGEVRPETGERSGEVFRTQEAALAATYGPILDAAVAEGRLTRTGDRYARAKKAGLLERLRWRLYFVQSKMRATSRWFKYILTFDGWIDYIVRKVERRAGIHVHVTEAERRWPFLLLWPKAIRVLLQLRARRTAVAAPGEGGGR